LIRANALNLDATLTLDSLKTQQLMSKHYYHNATSCMMNTSASETVWDEFVNDLVVNTTVTSAWSRVVIQMSSHVHWQPLQGRSSLSFRRQGGTSEMESALWLECTEYKPVLFVLKINGYKDESC